MYTWMWRVWAYCLPHPISHVSDGRWRPNKFDFHVLRKRRAMPKDTRRPTTLKAKRRYANEERKSLFASFLKIFIGAFMHSSRPGSVSCCQYLNGVNAIRIISVNLCSRYLCLCHWHCSACAIYVHVLVWVLAALRRILVHLHCRKSFSAAKSTPSTAIAPLFV